MKYFGFLNEGFSIPKGIFVTVLLAFIIGGVILAWQWWEWEKCNCPEIYDPVCGVDGKTYTNLCEAQCNGIEIKHTGACEGKKLEGNNILVLHSQEGEQDVLTFNINLQNYSTISEDLSKLGEEFKNYGSELIAPPKFNIPSEFSFIKIETHNGGEPCKPEIPYLMIEITLPLSIQVQSKLINVEEEKLKERIEIVPEIVCVRSGWCQECPDYLTDDQFFPENIFVSQDIREFDTYSLARIYLPLFRHNPATRETYMVKKANIKVSYKLPLPLVLTEFSTDKTKYSAGETINASAKLVNVGLEPIHDLQANLSLINPFGKIIASASSEKFDLEAEEFKEIPIKLTLGGGFQGGNYRAELQIVDNQGRVLATSSKYLDLYSGEIIKFSLPKEVEEGETVEFEILFKNYDLSEVEAIGKVSIYDHEGVRIAELLSNPVKVKPGSTGLLKVSWDTSGKEPGEYSALPTVSVGERVFLAESQEFIIKKREKPTLTVSETQLLPSAKFSPRCGAASVVFKDKIWILGGWAGGSDLDGLNDVWCSSDGVHWSEATSNAEWSGRFGHAAVVFKNKIWILGPNDVWNSEDGIHWKKVVSNPEWAPRKRHTAVVFQDKIWIIGGLASGEWLNDVWNSEDGIHWTQVVSNAPWSGRASHSSVVFKDKIWVMGGWIGDAGNPSNDVWFSIDGKNWEKAPSPGWEPRSEFVALVYKDKMCIIGGRGTDWYKNDVWCSSDGKKWKEVISQGKWSPRAGHISLVHNGRIYIIGGIGENKLNDVWEITIKEKSEASAEYKIYLSSRQFIPEPGISDTLRSMLANTSSKRIHVLLQFYHIPNNDERYELSNLNVTLCGYVHNNAYFASIPTKYLTDIYNLSFVRWIGEILPEDKISRYIRNGTIGDWAINPNGTVNLIVVFFKDVSLDDAELIIEHYDGVTKSRVRSINALVVTIPQDAIYELANEDSVQWIEEVPPQPIAEPYDITEVEK